MKRILQVLHSLSGGGIENLLYSYLTNMDLRGLKFDFVVYGDEKGAIEPWFEKLGCEIMRVPHRHDGLKAHCAALEKIIAEGKYDVVHSHQSEKGFITLRIAKRHGIKTRILHSHSAFPPESAKERLLREAGAALGKHYATDLFACSRDAGVWLYGESAVKAGKVRVVPNAIDISRFAFDAREREEVRKELGIEGRFAVGCAARFTAQKNHMFLLEIFKLLREARPEAVLLLAGDGELYEKAQTRAKELGIENDVRFLGVRTDVPRLLLGMDAFALPSVFEGLGIVFLEAQAAGLRTFGPDIPGARDTAVSSLMTKIKPSADAGEWARAIAEVPAEYDRSGAKEELARAGYDINQQAKILEEFYRKA